MWVYYFFAGVLICLGLLQLLGIFKFSAYVKEQIKARRSDYAPYASVIAPYRGLEDGLRENIRALFQQTYPEYEIIFVTRTADDPALKYIEEVANSEANSHISSRTLIAGDAIDSGQKVHNLRFAVDHLNPRSEVIVFVDSDARPNKTWLRSLIAPLADETLGASTGYRWFIPSATLAAQLRSLWNASVASALGGLRHKNFCWGGSTAIRRSTFERLKVKERWQGTVSDDFTLTRVLQEQELPIHFAPACLVPSVDNCSFAELFEFSNRQLKITRVYSPGHWKQVLAGSAFFCLIFFGGGALVVVRAAYGLDYCVPLVMLLLVYLLGTLRALIRFVAISRAITAFRTRFWASLPTHVLLWPLGSVLFLWNSIVAAFSRRIDWRGTTYELRSARDTTIISVSDQK